MCRQDIRNTIERDSLRIIAVNVNSIIKNYKRASLLALLEANAPDICLVSETKLNDKHNLEFQDYVVIRKDRPNSVYAGGTAILIKKMFKFQIVHDAEFNKNKCLETTIISVKISNSKNIFIISAYAPKSSTPDIFLVELENIFKKLQLHEENNYYILAGDLNAKHAKWRNTVSNTRGNQLFDWYQNNRVLFKMNLLGTDMPSFPRGNSYLDLALTDMRLKIKKQRDNEINCLETIPYDSDHNALKLEASLDDSPLRLLRQEQDTKYIFGKTNWKTFNKEISKSFRNNRDEYEVQKDRNLENAEIETYLERLNNLIQNSIEKTVPKIKSKNGVDCYTNTIIKKLEKEKSKTLSSIKTIYRRFQDYNNPYLVALKSKLNNIKKLIKDNFRKSINKYWHQKIQNIKTNDPNMFPSINKIFRKSKKIQIPVLHIKQDSTDLLQRAAIDTRKLTLNEENDYLVEDPDDKLNIIGASFERTYSVNETSVPNEVLERIVNQKVELFRRQIREKQDRRERITTFNSSKRSDSLTEEQTDNFFTTFQETKEIFRRLNNKKSSGVDKTPNIILKHLPTKVIRQYCALFNNMLNNTYQPEAWKTALTFPIQKKDKNKNGLENLRSINLLPNISKVLEVIVNKRTITFCNSNNIIPENQFGFQYKHSTINAINKLTSDIMWNFNKNQCTGACLIDLEKAFDTVWIEGLLFKLIKKKFPENLIAMISEIITNKKFLVTDGINISKLKFKVKNGLQQGMVNSPILYNIYSSDLLASLSNTIAYADDLIVYETGKKIEDIQEKVQSAFDFVQMYCNNWKLKININKCEAILFRTPLSKATRNIRKNWKSFQIIDRNSREIIKQKLEVKYLGVSMDQYLYFHSHVNQQLQKSKNSFNKIRRLFFSKFLDQNVKITCYKTLIRPILLYGCPIWFNISPSYMERIRVLERHCLRACLGKYRDFHTTENHCISNVRIYNLAKINRIDNFIIRQIRRHFSRSTENSNSLIRGPTILQEEYMEKARASGFIPPEGFIHLDITGRIQDLNGIPIIYHIYRRATDRAIRYEQNVAADNIQDLLRFDVGISAKDKRDFEDIRKNSFWWLEES